MEKNKIFKIIVFLLSIIIIIVMVYKFTGNIFQKKAIINCLKCKYGDNSFKVVSLKKNSSNFDDFAQRWYTSYDAIVSSIETKDNFYFTYYKTSNGKGFAEYINPLKYNDFTEDFLATYYKDDFYIKDDITFLIKIDSSMIPNNFGRIPTLAELLELNAIIGMHLFINDSSGNYMFSEIKDKTEFLKQLVKDVVTNLNIPQNAHIHIGISLPNDDYTSYQAYVLENDISVSEDL